MLGAYSAILSPKIGNFGTRVAFSTKQVPRKPGNKPNLAAVEEDEHRARRHGPTHPAPTEAPSGGGVRLVAGPGGGHFARGCARRDGPRRRSDFLVRPSPPAVATGSSCSPTTACARPKTFPPRCVRAPLRSVRSPSTISPMGFASTSSRSAKKRRPRRSRAWW